MRFPVTATQQVRNTLMALQHRIGRRIPTTTAKIIVVAASLVAASISAVDAPPVRADVAALVNPGLEGPYIAPNGCSNVVGAIATGWYDNTCWDSSLPAIRYDADTTSAHGGANAQRVTLVSGGRAQFTQPLAQPLERNVRARVSLWLRGTAPHGVKIFIRETAAPYTTFSSRLIVPSKNWKSYTFDAFGNGQPVGLYFVLERPGTFTVDDADISLSPVTNVTATPPSTPVPARYFAMHTNYLDTPWPAVGDAVGLTRIWDAGENHNGSGTGAQWADVAPTATTYDWSGLDARVAAAQARGAEIIYTLGGRTPQWASKRPNEFSPYGPGEAAEPRSDLIWQQWIAAITTRYSGRIKYWEIWNEPDLAYFFTGTPATLSRLGRLAYAKIKTADPNNVVLSPGFSGFDGPWLLDDYLRRGGGNYADVISYHDYVDAPEDISNWYAANVRSVLNERTISKPLWNTEQGWLDFSTPTPPQFTANKSRGFIARSALLNWASGFGVYAYYTWDNRANQIVFAQADGSLGPGGEAYRTVTHWMRGSVIESVSVDAFDTYTITLRSAAGTRTHAVWNAHVGRSYAVPKAWNATTISDLQGRTRAVNDTETVGISPLLIT